MRKTYVPIVPEYRLIEIIKGYVEGQSTATTRPDMNSELHLLELSKLLMTEARARLPLWQLENGGAE